MSEVSTPVSEETEAPASAPVATSKFEDFDSDFQLKLVAMLCRNDKFARAASHLIDPANFDDIGHMAAAKVAIRHYEKYGTVLNDRSTAALSLKDALASHVLKTADKKPAIETLTAVFATGPAAIDVSGSTFAMTEVEKFAKAKAFENSILQSVDLLKKGDFGAIEKLTNEAARVGLKKGSNTYDYWGRVEERTSIRKDRVAGVALASGISTGYPELDAVLYHKGWGRKELVSLLGGAKSGKTTALIGFAKMASLAGYNVLYVTLEVAAAIISDRLDASISHTKIKDLSGHIMSVEDAVKKHRGRVGRLDIEEFPTGTFRPMDLDALLELKNEQGITYDLVVTDYADIMCPDVRDRNNAIANSKSIYEGLRAVMQKFNVAGLTATQTNREGYTSTVAKAEHTSDDFNKVRIVDLLISINATQEERDAGEARLFFAAARNTEDKFSLKIKTDLSRMIFIERIIGRA